MVRPLDRIERDIEKLESSSQEIAEELQQTYEGYLKVLGEAVRGQAIVATYHICTHGNPEAFLELTLDRRQQLQGKIRTIASEARSRLAVVPDLLLATRLLSQLPDPSELLEALSNAKSLEDLEAEWPDAAGADTFDVEEAEEPESALSPEEELERAEEERVEQERAEEERAEGERVEETPNYQFEQPESVARWQEHLEGAIAQQLQDGSRQINRALQEFGILPPKLPPMLLEAAAKVPGSDSGVGVPNLLNLTVEAETPEEMQQLRGKKRKRSQPLQIVAVQLRLSEIELGDAQVMAARHQIRHLLHRLNTLKREYRTRDRERAVARAEAAWRASWFDEGAD
ncbi:hypothetical protein [Oxynema aestuarii]|jgi:hypothetical protein|uniref:Uncharacterized protein n=1 Tax=Oxynema aestuarii AP17 TaxID=2064643 RepID=A0A6H1U1M9_9CYAN|nr:hypothetical protein [Oxynema aestuarii]QIZ72731.1 hypothetical protein HCG48_20800 [Oxynema aestuarii AP17]RMH75765.1 MAG: hypothetical protein D6680_10815 [Cyanobacteria bacterium J007]